METHLAAPVQMVLLETDVKMLINVLLGLVKIMEPVWMGWIPSPVSVQKGLLERDVRPTLMIVRESFVRIIRLAMMELIIIPAYVQVD